MMQRNKTIRNLFLVLVMLIIVLVGKDYLPKGPSEKDEYLQLLNNLTVQDIATITVSKGGKSLILVKDGGEWKVDKYLANVTQLNNMLESIIEPARVELVSETNQRYEALGVSENAPTIKIGKLDGDVLVYMGSTTTGGRYIRLDGHDRVYLVDGLTNNMSSIDVADWVDKTIISIDEKTITRMSITQTLTTIVLEQREGEWYKEGSEAVLDRTSLSAILNTLNSFVTQGLFDAEGTDDSYEQTAEIGLVIERNGLDPVELAFYRGDDDALVTSTEREGRYVISSALMDNFVLSDNDLLVKVIDDTLEQ